MASSEKIIVTLLAERGAKFDETGEAIASFSRSIVFLPRGTEPGKNYRVVLEEISGKTDRRGCPLYRAVPAEVEYTERWKDLGDGTASRFKIATDWLLAESEVEILETRPLATREGGRTGYSDYHIVWGQDLASSTVEDRGYIKIGLESEQVERGQLAWRRTGDRQEPRPVERGGVTAVEVTASNPAKVRVWFDTTGFAMNVSPQALWVPLADLPYWVSQRNTACDRCGQQGKQIKLEDDRAICAACEPYESAEALINAELPMERRQAIAAEASRLLAGRALPREAGEVVLRATVDHITDSWRRDQLLQKWAGYGWYYFCEDGVFTTKLAPAALSVLRHLPQAQGNGLVELVAWLVGGPKAGSSDYYLRTQVNSESGVRLPTIATDQLKQVVVDDRLRGPEADRQEAVRRYRLLVGQDEYADGLAEVSEIFQADEQSYALALERIAEIEWRLSPEGRDELQRRKVMEQYARDLEYAESQVVGNYWTRLSFRRGRHPKTGEAQWQAGNRYVKYVLDRYSSAEPVEGQEYYCSLGKILVDTPNFRLQLVYLEPPFPEDAPTPEAPEPSGETSKEVTPEMLDALRAKFNGGN